MLVHEFTDLENDDESAVLVSHPGVAEASNGSSLFAYDAAVEEDIFEYQSDFARVEIYSIIMPAYNASRGAPDCRDELAIAHEAERIVESTLPESYPANIVPAWLGSRICRTPDSASTRSSTHGPSRRRCAGPGSWL